MYSQEQIQEFIAELIGVDLVEVTSASDIHFDLGCTGDDFDEFMQAYAERFNVKMDNYRWYFHTDEEGQNFGSFFFKAPNERVEHIAVTPALLLDFANKGYWDLHYPQHKLPKRRYDILVNQVLAVVVISWLVYKCAS